jgi:hypothetical protein
MTRFVVGDDRSQSTLFPERLEDYLSEDNPVRAIDVFVEGLNLGRLGFGGVEPEATGRPADCFRARAFCSSILIFTGTQVRRDHREIKHDPRFGRDDCPSGCGLGAGDVISFVSTVMENSFGVAAAIR